MMVKFRRLIAGFLLIGLCGCSMQISQFKDSESAMDKDNAIMESDHVQTPFQSESIGNEHTAVEDDRLPKTMLEYFAQFEDFPKVGDTWEISRDGVIASAFRVEDDYTLPEGFLSESNDFYENILQILKLNKACAKLLDKIYGEIDGNLNEMLSEQLLGEDYFEAYPYQLNKELTDVQRISANAYDNIRVFPGVGVTFVYDLRGQELQIPDILSEDDLAAFFSTVYSLFTLWIEEDFERYSYGELSPAAPFSFISLNQICILSDEQFFFLEAKRYLNTPDKEGYLWLYSRDDNGTMKLDGSIRWG